MIDAKRRILLKGSLSAGSVGVAVSAGLLSPRLVLADWNEAAFKAREMPEALTALVGSESAERDERIRIKAPDIAENGAVVPVTVEADIEGVTSIAIFAEKNQTPLIASFELAPNAMPFVSTRIKMAETADVTAVVKVGDQVFKNSKSVKVTIGGCGG
ncbi:thiosulfate oxidation carrier protein SoxY [Marichromatium gracile]|uniref:Thiosulfate-binding protein SoxY n=1 Tax=Marichromatium gracile TaxID=1048 RepID=A0A4V2WA85_MARGR|nr:thiosulfate oxidation carrier protein SoxY [Marichromatium gracile]MBK1708229.1 thiosulfate oxidation carrier protein SoxY [Marichromatium gracile]TCW38310.1 thiosulfate-binding protein SoxY [Marichromatium gracile]